MQQEHQDDSKGVYNAGLTNVRKHTKHPQITINHDVEVNVKNGYKFDGSQSAKVLALPQEQPYQVDSYDSPQLICQILFTLAYPGSSRFIS